LIKSWLDHISLNSEHETMNINEAIIISGAPRSGTTLVMEILSLLPKYKTIFEPLHRTWFPSIRRLNLPPRIYIPPERDNPFLHFYLRAVFKGKIVSKAPKYSLTNLNEVYKRLTATKAIIKFVNGNRLLPWISERFQVKGTYLIIRHPCATILSQLRTGWLGYPIEIEQQIKLGRVSLLKNIILREALMIPKAQENPTIIQKIKNLNTMEELLAVEWSLDYLVPLSQFDKYSWYLLPYERLLVQFNEELKLLFGYINQYPPKEAWKKLKVPSKTATISAPINKRDQLIKWKKKLSERQIKNILKVVHWFGLDFYTEAPEPDYDSIKKWRPSF